jgi:transcriptional regulator GlxA family with amidase domain
MMTNKNKRPGALTPMPRSKKQAERIRDRRVQIVRVLLEDHFHRKLALRDMGKAVSLSSWRLAHLFKAEIGMSPQRYLTLVRLQRAKHRLENGFLPVKQIAASVGIPNASQFTRSFKAAYGMTPAEYRRLHLRMDTAKDSIDSLVAPRVQGGSLQQPNGDERLRVEVITKST